MNAVDEIKTVIALPAGEAVKPVEKPVVSIGTESAAQAVKPLNEEEQRLLNEAELSIGSGLLSFVEVGKALDNIQAHQLHRTVDGAFPKYCRKRWNLDGKKVCHLIDAAVLYEKLRAAGLDPLPINETQLELVMSFSAKRAVEIWKQVLTVSNGAHPTAAKVKAAVKKLGRKKVKRTSASKKKPSRKHRTIKKSVKVGSLVTNTLRKLRLWS